MGAIWNDIIPYHKLSEAPGFGLNGAYGKPDATTTTAEKSQRPSLHEVRALNLPKSLKARARRANQTFNQWVTRRGKEVYGSNAWAVTSDGTEGGGALLAGDGHLELSVPSLFYQMCVDDSYFGTSDFKTCGLYFPGLPYMAVGTSGHIAKARPTSMRTSPTGIGRRFSLTPTASPKPPFRAVETAQHTY